MAIDDADRRLDGNAAAGHMAEVFRVETTTAVAICAGCGAEAPLAELMRYGHELGEILRCPGCDTAVLRLARTRDNLWLDLRGARSLRLVAAP